MVEYSLLLISFSFDSINNFLFHHQSDILATQTKINEGIVNLPLPLAAAEAPNGVNF